MNPNTYLLTIGIVFFVSLLIAAFFIIPTLKKEYVKTAMQEVTQDISEEEMRLLEANLSSFLAENNLKVGASLEEVARVLNVVDVGATKNMSSRATISKEGIVRHDKKVPAKERRFDFAHELGHRINKDPIPATRPHGFNKPKEDQLADYTGAALLMPLEHVHNFLLQREYPKGTKRKRMALIRELSRKYNVSEIVAIRRVNEICLLKKI